ncbi:MAG: hypothetical protein AAF602_12285, partial [Myxococcota bacterium]
IACQVAAASNLSRIGQVQQLPVGTLKGFELFRQPLVRRYDAFGAGNAVSALSDSDLTASDLILVLEGVDTGSGLVWRIVWQDTPVGLLP